MPTASLKKLKAKSDVYKLSTGFLVVGEDTTGFKIKTASLMANDLGSNKTLFGLGVGSAQKTDTSAKGASLSFSKGNIVYDPNGRFDSLSDGQTAIDTFTYTIKGKGGFSTATVKVLIKGANDKPNGNADFYELVNKTASGNVLGNDNDVDARDTVTAVLATGPTKGVLKFKPDGSFTYTQNAGAWGNDTFTYRAYDGKKHSELVTVTLQGSAEPAKATFGASKGGTLWDTAQAPGDHYRVTVDFDARAEAAGYSDSGYVEDYSQTVGHQAYESDLLTVEKNFSHENWVTTSTELVGKDSSGNRMYATHTYEMVNNAQWSSEAVMEFEVSKAVGLVSGATLKFESGLSRAYDAAPEYYPPSITFDVYVNTGDNAITFEGDRGGTLAGHATIANDYLTQASQTTKWTTVTLDAAAINTILASGSDYVSIRVASDLTDSGSYGSPLSRNFEQISDIRLNTASLEFIYA